MVTVQRSPSAPAFNVAGHPHVHYMSLSTGNDKQLPEPEAVFLTTHESDPASLLSTHGKVSDAGVAAEGEASYHAVRVALRKAGILTTDRGWHCVELLQPEDLTAALQALAFDEEAIRVVTAEAEQVFKRWRGSRRSRLRKDLRSLMKTFGCPRGFIEETVAKAEKIVRGEISY